MRCPGFPPVVGVGVVGWGGGDCDELTSILVIEVTGGGFSGHFP